jgi:hypothetical protein
MDSTIRIWRKKLRGQDKKKETTKMKKMMQTALVVCLMTAFIGVATVSAKANDLQLFAFPPVGDQDFMLVNNTDVEIYALYVTPHSSDDWGDDILGIDTLPPGEQVLITFARKEKARYWDLRVEDSDGAYIEWDKLNLLKIASVKLYYKNGEATALIN